LTAAFLVLGVVRTIQRPGRRIRLEQQLSEQAAGELHDLGMPKSQRHGWFGYWGRQASRAGVVSDSPTAAGWLPIRNAAFAALAGAVVFPGGVFGGVAGFAAGIAGTVLWWGYQARKRTAVMDKQLPLLLASLRSHLQTGATPQQALMAVADELPAPLGDELQAVKKSLSVAIPLDQTLQQLAERVPTREMQFLASSIEVAVRSGAALDGQLATIESIVRSRTRLRQNLATALASVRPTKWAAIAAVPLFFLNSLRTPENREFWFSADGLPWLLGAAALTFVGIWGMRLLVQRVETL
jgi:tight adherence protein B